MIDTKSKTRGEFSNYGNYWVTLKKKKKKKKKKNRTHKLFYYFYKIKAK